MFRTVLKCLLAFGATAFLNLAAATAPVITTQPANKAVTLGAAATFTVAASGTGPLTYQWSRNGSSISGATSASYTTPATVATDTGASITVKVTNGYGNVTSFAAILTVNLPPSISTQPGSQTGNLGGTFTFSVAASGTGTLSYQWYKNATTLSGATAASYTTPGTVTGDNGARYTVKVTNGAMIWAMAIGMATLPETLLLQSPRRWLPPSLCFWIQIA